MSTQSMEKSLDRKIARILADPSCRDFILADAKDADMAFGLAAPGRSPERHAGEGRFRTLAEYRQLMREIVAQEQVDIMLMTRQHERAAGDRGAAVRLQPGHAGRPRQRHDRHLAGRRLRAATARSRRAPFRTATLDHIQCGQAECRPPERRRGADLGLYSVTFNNDVELDRRTLEAYRAFRIEAESKGFRHFLEVFDPNAPAAPAGRSGPVHQRQHRPHAGRRDQPRAGRCSSRSSTTARRQWRPWPATTARW